MLLEKVAMEKGDRWQRSLEVLHDDQAIDVMAKALACAYGISSSMSIPLVRRVEEGDGTSDHRSANLSVFRRGPVQQSAKGYLPVTAADRDRMLNQFKPFDRKTALDFDGAVCMRNPGSSTRTRQIRTWKPSSVIVAMPSVRPSRAAIHALIDARLAGPLEAWLLLYAAGQTSRWPVVARYMGACGHPEWAAQEAALRIMGTRRPFREVAREVAMREAHCRNEVNAAERRLMGWLTRASRQVAEAMNALVD